MASGDSANPKSKRLVLRTYKKNKCSVQNLMPHYVMQVVCYGVCSYKDTIHCCVCVYTDMRVLCVITTAYYYYTTMLLLL